MFEFLMVVISHLCSSARQSIPWITVLKTGYLIQVLNRAKKVLSLIHRQVYTHTHTYIYVLAVLLSSQHHHIFDSWLCKVSISLLPIWHFCNRLLLIRYGRLYLVLTEFHSAVFQIRFPNKKYIFEFLSCWAMCPQALRAWCHLQV